MKTLIATGFVWLAAWIAAGGAMAATETAPVQDVVVTATRLPANLSVTPGAYVIDRQDIDDRQLTFASQALQSAPGLSVFSNGPFGVTSVRQRGAGSDKTLVLIDGVAVNDISQPQGSFDFSSYGLDDVRRIEVLSGPQASLWGSDAIGGVIAITSRDIDGVRASLEGGSFGTVHGAFALGTATEQGALGFTASAVRSDGISAADSHNDYIAYGFPKLRNSENDGLRDQTLGFRGRLRLSDAVQIDGSVRYDHARTDIDGYPAATFYVLADTRDVYDSKSLLGQVRASAEAPLGLHNELSLSAYKLDRGARGESGDYGYRANSATIRWTVGKGGLDDRVSFQAGLERLSNKATLSTGASVDRGDSSAFAVVRLKPVQALTLTVSERYDAYDRIKGVATGRVGAALAIGGGFSLEASAGQGFKTPTLSETACDFCYAAPGSLRPEHASAYDGGAAWRSPGGRVVARVTAFQLNIRDEITYSNGRYINLAQARSRGTEVSLKAALAGRFQLEAAYGYTNAIDVATGRPQLRAPKAVSSATLSWQGAKANLALSVRSQTSQADTALDGFSPVVRPGYAVADLAGSYVLSSRVILTARVENLAGDSYQEAYGFGAPGRAVYLGLRLTQ